MQSDGSKSVERIAESLELEAHDHRTFDAVCSLLRGRRDWQQLDKAYRRMIHLQSALPKSAILSRLWVELAGLYRTELNDVSRAIVALEQYVASTDDIPRMLELGLLYEETDALDAAIGLYERIMSVRASSDACQRLFDIHMHRRALDAAWCAAAVLVEGFDGELSEVERTFYSDHVPRRLSPLRDWLDQPAWRLLRHPEDDEAIRSMLRVVAPKPKRELASSTGPALSWALAALGGLPSSVALEPYMALDDALRDELFNAGRDAAMLRDPRVADIVLHGTPRELEIMFWTAVVVAYPDRSPPDSIASEVQREATPFKYDFEERRRAALRRLVDGLGSVNLERFRRAFRLTAQRAGLVIAGDFATAMRALKQATFAEPAERIRAGFDLFAFSASRDLVALRDRLGIGLSQRGDDTGGAGEGPGGAFVGASRSTLAPRQFSWDDTYGRMTLTIDGWELRYTGIVDNPGEGYPFEVDQVWSFDKFRREAIHICRDPSVRGAIERALDDLDASRPA